MRNPGETVTVVHIFGELRHSGAEVMLADSIDFYAKHHVATRVISTGRVGGQFTKVLRERGAQVCHIPFTPNPKFLMTLIGACRGADVVHLHTEKASFWLAGCLRLARFPVVRTVHSSFPFEGRLRFVRACQRRILNRIGVNFVAIGTQVATNERTRFGISPRVIHNWADQRYYDEAWQLCEDHEDFRIVSVGNCGEPKNHETLLSAIAEIQYDLPVTYTHVGDESHAVVDERELARTLDIEPICVFAGTRDPLNALLHADVFVMPSIREGFGLAALEAIALGVPTVLADSPGLREFSSVPGVWWSRPEAGSLSEALRLFAKTPAPKRAKRAREAADYAARHFGPTHGRQEYLGLYQRSLTGEARQ